MIASQDILQTLVPKVREAAWAAIDTEADSLHAYPEKLCLLQISLPGSDYLVDTLAGLDLADFLAALDDHDIILHGGDYDLRLLYRTYRFVPSKVFDTMLAARLLGEKEVGLNSLVSRFLNIKLEKGPQTMNWARRPLTERMEKYAYNDTHYLCPLTDILRGKLQEKGRLAWHEATCAKLIEECARPRETDPDTVWRVRGSDVLNEKGLAILRELWKWREEEAVEANKPPYFILSHEKMNEIAGRAAHGSDFREAFPRHFSERRRGRLQDAVERGLRVEPSHYPRLRRSSGQRLTRAEQLRFEELRKKRDVQAAALALEPSLIASKSALVGLSRECPSQPSELMEWQRGLLQ